MGKSRSKHYDDYAEEQKTFSAMDRRDARKRKGQKKDPEADVEVMQRPIFPANGRR